MGRMKGTGLRKKSLGERMFLFSRRLWEMWLRFFWR